jgi:hypothetical protein
MKSTELAVVASGRDGRDYYYIVKGRVKNMVVGVYYRGWVGREGENRVNRVHPRRPNKIKK